MCLSATVIVDSNGVAMRACTINRPCIKSVAPIITALVK